MIQFCSQIILGYFCCYAYFLSLSDINPYTIHSFESVAQHHAVYCIVSLYTHTHTLYIVKTLQLVPLPLWVWLVHTMIIQSKVEWITNLRCPQIWCILVYAYSSLHLWFISFWRATISIIPQLTPSMFSPNIILYICMSICRVLEL